MKEIKKKKKKTMIHFWLAKRETAYSFSVVENEIEYMDAKIKEILEQQQELELSREKDKL